MRILLLCDYFPVDRFESNDSVSTNILSRTLRILFAMARQIPVLTPSWVYASLEGGGQWLLSPSEYERFLHPRFNPRTLSKKLSKPSTVYVGPCIDPSRRIVESLVQCCDLMTLTTSLKKAEWVVVGKL